MGRMKIDLDPESLRIQVVFLRTARERLEGEFEVELNEAVSKAKAKYPHLIPLIESLEKPVREENAAALAIVLTQEINNGINDENDLLDCLENARAIIEEWVKVSKTAGKVVDK